MATGAPSSKKLAATAHNNKMAATAHHTKLAAGGHQNKMSSSVLLQQIQTLSDLQNSGVVHHADPAAQVRNKNTCLPSPMFIRYRWRYLFFNLLETVF